jgi:hypothetical protein
VPRGDRTGPWGEGPMTGRAAGYCAGYSVPGYVNSVGGYGRGRGWVRGRGRCLGRGWGRGFGRSPLVYPQPARVQPAYHPTYQPIIKTQTPEQEIAALENYHKNLEAEKADLLQETDGVEARIEELKAKLEK